jgi:hypothetical protein
MAQVLVESISRALKLPRPHLHEPNRSFTLVEDWAQLVELVARQPIAVKPLGYYRTPDAVDMCEAPAWLARTDTG